MKMNPVVHFELGGDDLERMKKFYQSAFGWELKQLGPEMGNYVLAQTDETDVQGMLKQSNRINGGLYKREKGEPPHIVVSVENLKEKMEEVKSAGGQVEGEPMPIPGIGDFVMVKDTEGNRVGMLQPYAGM